MKKFALVAVVLSLARSGWAGPYFHLIDPAHMQMSAGFLISPKTPSNTAGVTDLAIVTHSSADGTVVPEKWQSVLPPESWVPLQVGFGGSFKGEAIIAPGTS